MGPLYTNMFLFIGIPCALFFSAIQLYGEATEKFGERLRLLTAQMYFSSAVLATGPVFAFVVFANRCTSAAHFYPLWGTLLALVAGVVVAAYGNLGRPTQVQKWTIIIQGLILALILWTGILPVMLFDFLGAGLQMSGGSRQIC